MVKKGGNLMKIEYSSKKRKTNIRSMVVLFVFIMLIAIFMSACGDNSTGTGSMKDPYEAYGVKRGEGKLGFSILDDPPKAIAIQPIMIKKAYHEDAMLAVEPMVFERGTNKSFSFDFQLKHENGESYPLKGTVDIKYLRDDSDGLFSIDTDAYGYATLVRNGIYKNEAGQHTVKGRSTSFSSFGGDSEEYLSFTIGVDKKDAQKADGNLGIVYCKITGVKK